MLATQEKVQSMYRRTPIIFRILDSFFRYQVLFWTSLLIVSSLTMAALYARSKTFHASALTQVQTDSVANKLGTPDANTWITPAQKNTDRFMEMIRQDQPGGFLDTALRGAHLAKPIDVNPRNDDPRYVALQKNLTANVQSANIFSIDLTWDNPEETQNITTALQNQYISEVGDDQAIVSTQTVHFLDVTLADVETRMRASEKALTDYKSSMDGQMAGPDSGFANQLSSLTAQRDEKQITQGQSARRKSALQAELAQLHPMSILETSIAEQTPLQHQVGELLARRATLLAQGRTPQHPDVVRLDSTISELQRQQRINGNAPENRHDQLTKMQDNPQYQALREQITDASIAASGDQQEIQNLDQQINKYEALVRKIPAAQRMLVDKTREYSMLTDSEHRLQQQREQARLQERLLRATASNSLQQIGVTYAQPTTGKTKMIAMLLGSLLLGSLVGSLLIVLSEWSDHSLRHESDAERLLGVPVLAALPETSSLLVAAPRRLLGGREDRSLPSPAPEGQNL